MDHVHALLDDVVIRGVGGGFVEAGCWKGGVAMLAAAVLHKVHLTNRTVWFADSFEGLPTPDLDR